MTKLVLCTYCSDIVMPFRESGATKYWRYCECGKSGVRWRDGGLGLLEVTSVYGPDFVRTIGMNNSFLYSDLTASTRIPTNIEWRELHERSSKQSGEYYLFHESGRNCWACIIPVGETGDVFFIDWDSRNL